MSYVTAPGDGKRPEPIVNILIDPVTAGAALHAHGLMVTPDLFGAAEPGDHDDLTRRRCETSSGVAIHPDVAMVGMITGHIRRVVVDSSDVVINMGRARRLFTGRARTAAQLLTDTCAASGCSVPAGFCDVDHLDEWAAHAGPTNQRNGGPLCGGHDRHKHQHRLRAKRAANGRIRLLRPDGTVIKPAGERDPEWAQPDPPDEPGSPPSSPSRSAPPRADLGRCIGWDEYVATRPDISDVPDPGWAIYHTVHVVGDTH